MYAVCSWFMTVLREIRPGVGERSLAKKLVRKCHRSFLPERMIDVITVLKGYIKLKTS